MFFTSIVSAAVLQLHLDDPTWIVMDCRFSLDNSEAGVLAYKQGHITNARYAHLNEDLSSKSSQFTGRHPLPDFTLLAKKLGTWGITNNHQIIAYDDAGGAFAGRFWWLLRCMGHNHVALLNGGIQHWQKQGFPLATSLPVIQSTSYRPHLQTAYWLNAAQVQCCLAKKSICLIDARTPERYRGEHEPIDRVPGHIPSALNRPFQLNLDKDGLFLSADHIASQFKLIIGNAPPGQVVHYCGSGVTACHNILAMEYAGLAGSRLYAGSWSDWIRDKNRAVAVGGTNRGFNSEVQS